MAPTTHTNTLLEAAQDYAVRGWSVLPCHTPVGGRCSCERADCTSPAKHPRTENGLNDATTDPDIIRKWWERWPDANIGIRTGQISGVVVLDIDPKNGGLESWSELQDIHTRVDTLICHTGGGGKHLYFKAPDELLKSTGSQIAPGIDTRAEGGYVIAPPSLHISGQRYEWEDPA